MSQNVVHIEVKNNEDAIVAQALAILKRRLQASVGVCLDSASSVGDYLTLKIASEKRERFIALYLDKNHKLIDEEVIAIGTVDNVAVSPRNIAAGALKNEAVGVIVAHNHPSGNAQFSTLDKELTQKIKNCLDACGLCLVDHILIAGDKVVSMRAENII